MCDTYDANVSSFACCESILFPISAEQSHFFVCLQVNIRRPPECQCSSPGLLNWSLDRQSNALRLSHASKYNHLFSDSPIVSLIHYSISYTSLINCQKNSSVINCRDLLDMPHQNATIVPQKSLSYSWI